MKINYILPLLFITFLFTGCVEKTVTIHGQSTVSPEFSTDSENLKSKISEIILAEDINISSGNFKKSGDRAYNFLTVEIISADDFPGGFAFSNLAEEIAEVLEEDIRNIDDYKKVTIEIRNTVEENNTTHTRTFRKEIEL